MVDLKIGQQVKVRAAVWDACFATGNRIYVAGVGINTIPAADTVVSCQDITGIDVRFILFGMTGSPQCNNCTPQVVYADWGTAYTDGLGIASVDHVISDSDMAGYQDAIAKGYEPRVLACIVASKGQQVGNSRCSDTLTILPGLAPTHFISLSLGFVPPQLAAYFQTYISGISSTLMTKIAPPPAPWQYLSTTYDATANAFNLWFYTPSTAALATTMGIISDLQELYNWFAAWVGVIVAVLELLLFTILFAAGIVSGLLFVVALFTGVVYLAWRVHDAITKEQIAETKATNLGIQLNETNKAIQADSAAESTWQSSPKSQADCTARLQAHRDIHLSMLNGYLDLYAKYPGLVGELNTELSDFTTKANAIISAFNAAQYTATTCDTYYVQLNDLIGTSDNTINGSLSKYIIPDQNYSVACKGWTNQAACEKSGCFWYNASCNQDEQCWISNPLGGCILSAKTGRAVVGATAVIFLTAFAYWLFTRHGKEITSIYVGAKEAAGAEVGRAKAAYKKIRAPAASQVTGAT